MSDSTTSTPTPPTGAPTPSTPPPGGVPPTPDAAPDAHRPMPPRWKWAPGTVAISILCGGVWLYTHFHPAWVEAGAMVPVDVWNGQWWRLVTSLFLHGSFFHVAFNVALWWNLGALVEARYGTVRLLLLMLVTGVAGGLGQMLAPGLGVVGAIGLSGAVYGVFFFGFFTLRPLGGPFGMLFSKTFAVILIGWGLFAVVLTRLHILPVANWAHLLGALTGAAIGLITYYRGWRRLGLALAGVGLGAGLVLAAWRPVWSPGWQAFEAGRLLSAHRYDEAMKRFAALYHAHPDNLGLKLRYAMALQITGNAVAAARIWNSLTPKEKARVVPRVRLFLEPGASGGTAGPAGGTDGGAPRRPKAGGPAHPAGP